RGAHQILHGDLTPHLRGLKPRPVHCRSIGKDAVELIRQLLSQEIPLPPSRRASVPIVKRRAHAVVDLSDEFRPQHLLFNAVADEILDEWKVVRAVGVDAGRAVSPAMAEIIAGADITCVHGRSYVQVACAATTT